MPLIRNLLSCEAHDAGTSQTVPMVLTDHARYASCLSDYADDAKLSYVMIIMPMMLVVNR